MDNLNKNRRHAAVDRLNASLARTHQEELQRMGMPVQLSRHHPRGGEQIPPMMTAGDLTGLHVLAELATNAAPMPTQATPQQSSTPGRSIPTIQLNGNTILERHDGSAQCGVEQVTNQHVRNHDGDECTGCKMSDEQMRMVLGCDLPNPLHFTVPARINKDLANMGLGSTERTRSVALHTHNTMLKINPLNNAVTYRAQRYIAHPEHFAVPEYPQFPPVLPTDLASIEEVPRAGHR